MRSEIEKMYENAEVKKQIPKICSSNELYCKECKAHIEYAMPYCKNAEYPPFTAEKQLSLVKWLINFDIRQLGYLIDAKLNFQEVLAAVINHIWVNTPEETHNQIKEILNG